MIYSLAPMEGITGHAFRRVHAECFGALDRYYTPFLPPPRVGSPFGGKNLKEVDPANNQGLNVVPQLLTKNADEFVWAARELAELGYREVNLNLGCPSGTVVSKGKGAGFLRNLDELEVFFARCVRALAAARLGQNAPGLGERHRVRAHPRAVSQPAARGTHRAPARAEGSLPGQTALGAVWGDARVRAVPGGLQRRRFRRGRTRRPSSRCIRRRATSCSGAACSPIRPSRACSPVARL